GGPAIEDFEREFSRFSESGHCVAVANGTDAVRFALMASGVGPGDAVVTVPNTFIATTEAISQAGALPLFVDVEERTCTLDPGLLRCFLDNQCRVDPSARTLVHIATGRRLAAVVPVHLYGQTADMDPILALAAEFRLPVIEDACQAHGAAY